MTVAAHQAVQGLPDRFSDSLSRAEVASSSKRIGTFFEEGAGDAQALALAERQLHAPVADNCFTARSWRISDTVDRRLPTRKCSRP